MFIFNCGELSLSEGWRGEVHRKYKLSFLKLGDIGCQLNQGHKRHGNRLNQMSLRICSEGQGPTHFINQLSHQMCHQDSTLRKATFLKGSTYYRPVAKSSLLPAFIWPFGSEWSSQPEVATVLKLENAKFEPQLSKMLTLPGLPPSTATPEGPILLISRPVLKRVYSIIITIFFYFVKKVFVEICFLSCRAPTDSPW